jgi:ankyrin repeat protein
MRIYPLLLFAFTSGVACAGPNEDILAASKVGNKAAVQAAIASGASVNAVDEKGLAPEGISGLTPLGLAAVYGHKNVALLLLSEGAKIDAVGITGETPLHDAAENGSTDVAKLLLDRGANVSARDIFGATPLAWAALKGHQSLATLLLARGAVVNVRAVQF